MSTEALTEKTSEETKTESVTPAKEEAQNNSQIDVPADSTGETVIGKKERYEQLIIRHGIPEQEKFIHKREQLYLMVEQMLSDAFIGKVIDYPSQTIDRLRMAAFVAGEDFLLKQLTDQEPQEEQIREWIEDFMKSTNAEEETGPANSSVEKSLDIMGRHMVRQQEIASAQITRLTEYIRQINEMERDKNEREIQNLREEHQKERENAQKRIDLLSDENFRLSMKIEETQEEAKKQADPGLFAQRRRNREQKRREEFIASVLGNREFSREQLAVIERVVSKDFSLPQLQKICDPKVKPENMELLEAYYERRRIHV
ncbi:MAG: hypothetical protein IJ589_04130 [Lachnospiraceae bacterium]|nr:hypothetical protein [Lachnospiraceae bacterium]